MEKRFGHDFSQVRIHTDGRASESARSVSAKAYTVGEHVAFAAGRYAPGTPAGERLIAHELAHVRQQAGRSTRLMPKLEVGEAGSPLEREAEAAADAVSGGRAPRVPGRSTGVKLHRHPDDIVGYSGGQSGRLAVLDAGKLAYLGPAVSGHPGGSEWEPNIGPTPTGMYHITPGVTQPAVTHVFMDAVCGAPYTALGYQEITSTDPVPCEAGSHHYCNVPCPTAANPAQLCWTPRDCWGPMRIRIEGGADVAKPSGGKVHRDGFYLHGGNPLDPISSGCVKSMDNAVFPVVRRLTGTGGRVRFCVGSACPASVTMTFAAASAAEAIVRGAVEAAKGALP
jgi:hypothetical protein